MVDVKRNPYPALPDLRDPKLLLLKPFLDWVRKKVPNVDAALTAAEAAQIAAVNAEASAGAAMAAVLALAASVASLETSKLGCVYTFSHPAFSVAAATTRRLWTGYVASTAWGVSDGWKPRYLIPDDGELVSLIVQHGTHTGGPSSIGYTVWLSTDDGATWNSTALTVARMSNDASFNYVASPIAVSRGDLIGVEAICAGAATGTERLNATVLYKRDA